MHRCSTARSSAEKARDFVNGRQLLELLKRLVTSYRSALMEGGTSKARAVFGKSDYAAKESETVMEAKPCGAKEPLITRARRSRCFGT